MIWLLPTAATVYPDVVSTPTPTMLETTTYVAIRRPKPEDTGGSPGKLGARRGTQVAQRVDGLVRPQKTNRRHLRPSEFRGVRPILPAGCARDRLVWRPTRGINAVVYQGSRCDTSDRGQDN